ncbi:MAG: DNA-binding response regulator [Bacteroidia bacterium]|nr:MAG: DNA-binding response regulator [Bacteroidia bacterium]
MIKTVIIDDERLARVELINLLNEISGVEIVGQAAFVDEALEIIEKEKPDLIFLDINMPEKSGFELIEELVQVPYCIFTTAYDEYALKAFEVGAVDYLLKPIQIQRLKDAIDKVKKLIEQDKEQNSSQYFSIHHRIFIRDGDKCFFVKVSDIKRIISEGNYARIFFKDQQALVHRSLNVLSTKLDPEYFFRANRQELINIQYIERIEPYFSNTLVFFLTGNIKVEVSRRQSVLFKDKFGI